LYARDTNNPDRADNVEYNYVLNAPRPGDVQGGIDLFINSANRTADGGASTATLRNANGNLRLGNPSYDTILEGDVDVNGSVSATHVSLGTPLYPTLGGNWLTIHSSTFHGSLGPDHPDPDGGILFTNASSQNTLPWGYYMGVVKDVASTSGATQRLDIGKSNNLNSQLSSGYADTLTPYLTIDNSNVGINTTSPRGKLDIYTGATSTPGLIIDRYTSGTYRSELYQESNGLAIKCGDGSNAPAEIMRLTSSGVGVGTSPSYNLEIYSNHASEPTFLRLVGNSSDRAGIILGENTSSGPQCILEYDGVGGGTSNRFHIYSEESGWKGKAQGFTYIPESGRVGIGSHNPGGLLHICSGTSGDCHLILQSDTDNNNELDNPKIVFRQDGAINTAEIGIENSDNKLAIRGTSGIAFYDGGISSTDIDNIENTSTELMRIESNGKVAIGATTAHAKLQVNGTGGYIQAQYYQRFRYDHTISGANQWGGLGGISIYGSNEIVSGSFFVSHNGSLGASDERIKQNIVDADDAECLDVLRQLKPKKYEYKDVIERGEEPVWGFIAQDVRDTLPHATQLRQEFIPNIYELANVSSSNVITFTEFNTSNLESNATTLIRTKGVDGEDHDIHLEEVIDEHTIRVEEDLTEWIGSVDETGNVVAGNQLFVYGQEISDFVFLKKESIWTVATAALQEVDRIQQQHDAQITDLEAAVASRDQQIDELRSELSDIVSRLEAVESG